MNKNKINIIIALIASIVPSALIFISCNNAPKPSKVIEKSQFDLTLKEIIKLDWATKLTDLPNIFPGGELRRMDPKIRTLSFYSIKANLTDIDEVADLTFHQNEEYIRGKTSDAFNIRKLYFNCPTIEDQKAKFEFLCAHVKSLDSKVYTTLNPDQADASFSIYDSDRKGGIKINIDMSNRASKNGIYVDFTRFKVNRR